MKKIQQNRIREILITLLVFVFLCNSGQGLNLDMNVWAKEKTEKTEEDLTISSEVVNPIKSESIETEEFLEGEDFVNSVIFYQKNRVRITVFGKLFQGQEGYFLGEVTAKLVDTKDCEISKNRDREFGDSVVWKESQKNPMIYIREKNSRTDEVWTMMIDSFAIKNR